MNTEIEKKKLIKYISNPELLQILKSAKCFIAGGAITSIFSNREINDIDVYFRDFNSLNKVLQAIFKIYDGNDDGTFEPVFEELESHDLIYTNHTDKSILFTKGELKVQFIYFKFFNSAQEIFDTFDFTINMGAYDCDADSLVLHDSFLKDIAQRRLGINTATSFPIMSLLRVDKYKQRGYSISKKDFVNLCLAVNSLNFETWKQMQEAIGGMYGYVYTELFDTSKPFTVDEAMTQLDKLDTDIVSNHAVSSIDYYTLIEEVSVKLNIKRPEDILIFYKKVVATDDPLVFSSSYAPSFLYPIGKIVNGGLSGLWAYKAIDRAMRHRTVFGTTSKRERIIKLKACAGTKIERQSDGTTRLFGDVEVIESV